MSDPRNEALAAEHAAVWTYAVLAARTSASKQPALLRLLHRDHTAHVEARDALLAALAAAKVTPAIAAPAYPLPARLESPASLEAAAAGVEAQCCTAYAWVVSQLSGQARRPYVEALEAAAVREVGLRGKPESFPGAADLG